MGTAAGSGALPQSTQCEHAGSQVVSTGTPYADQPTSAPGHEADGSERRPAGMPTRRPGQRTQFADDGSKTFSSHNSPVRRIPIRTPPSRAERPQGLAPYRRETTSFHAYRKGRERTRWGRPIKPRRRWLKLSQGRIRHWLTHGSICLANHVEFDEIGSPIDFPSLEIRPLQVHERTHRGSGVELHLSIEQADRLRRTLSEEAASPSVPYKVT